ncbi:HAD-IA family hydrolase [Candidatus Woesearchaeota archaeon]|nr:HAD-IA family hydrolase [Candidatus Woesearchaeota archaeon]
MVKALLFDVDDTLIPTTDFIEGVLYQAVIAIINAGLPEENPARAVQKLHELRRNNREHGNNFDLLCHVYGIDNKTIVQAAVKKYEDMKHASLQPNIHAVSVLEHALSNSYKLGVVTTGEPDKQIDKLKVSGLFDYFKGHIYASVDPKEAKPKPNLFQTALKALDAKAEESFYVGNRLDVDVAGAHNANIQAILLYCGKYAGQTPQSVLLQRGVKANAILEGAFKQEIRKMTPEHTITNLRQLLEIL